MTVGSNKALISSITNDNKRLNLIALLGLLCQVV
jgi:hypothetical protein